MTLSVNNIFKITPLMEASKQNDYIATKVLIKSGSDVNTKNIAGVTALHIASTVGSFETAKILIENGKATVNVEDEEKFTPLMRACLNKNSDIVELLLSNGAKIWNENIYGENALIHSTMAECYDCVELLYKYTDVQNINKSNSTHIKNQIDKALIIAYKKDNQKLEELLNKFLDKNESIRKKQNLQQPALNNENKLLLKKLNKNTVNVSENDDFKKLQTINKNQKLSDIKGEKKISKHKEYVFLWQKRPISYYDNLKKKEKYNNEKNQKTKIVKSTITNKNIIQK